MRFTVILVAVVILCISFAVALYRWNDHRQERFRELADRRASREVFLERLGRPDDVSTFAGAECWAYAFNRKLEALVCFGAETGDFERSSHIHID